MQRAMGQIRLYGIRHHGPGSARALLEALDAEPPDLLLVEGPPEAEPLLALIADSRVEPPVAILHYVAGSPGRTCYSPYAVFSPEWQAIRYALQREIPVRMIDLPLRHQLALADDEQSAGSIRDPLAGLAGAAGYDDPELWWEHLIEQRPADSSSFATLCEVMAELRDATVGDPPELERRREAWIRREVRLAAGVDPARRIAVVCGAWHLPVLDPCNQALPDELSDDRLLSGLPMVEVDSFWVPWSDQLLARNSGYGAGLNAPGWALHLWKSHGRNRDVDWITRAASLLRAQGDEVSPAAVIEATRLATALAATRQLTRPGLVELNDSILATLCEGDPERFGPVWDHLVIGDGVGRLPEDIASPPLLTDWRRQCRALRLDPQAGRTVIHLDLRHSLDLRRSRFFHQLGLLGTGWSRELRSTRIDNFRESWCLEWSPRVSTELYRAGMYGPTIESSAVALVIHHLGRPAEKVSAGMGIAELIDLFGRILRAGIGGARVEGHTLRLDQLVARHLDRLTVDQTDLRRLIEAFPRLVRLERYGSPHRFDPTVVTTIVDLMISRISLGVTLAPLAAIGEEPDEPLALLDEVDRAMSLAGRKPRAAAWSASLRHLFTRQRTFALIPGSIAGRAGLLLWQAGELSTEELHREIERALSPSVPASEAAAWIEGLIRPSGSIIAHDQQLLRVVDDWLAGLDEPGFLRLLPLLRRTFSRLPTVDRDLLSRSIAAQKNQVRTSATDHRWLDFDPARAELMLPILSRLLGAEMTREEDPPR